MPDEQQSIPVPRAIRELILHSNKLLQIYQTELTSKVSTANTEMMGILGLDPNDGWKLDIENMVYIKDKSSE